VDLNPGRGCLGVFMISYNNEVKSNTELLIVPLFKIHL
jgi:hypothetical protein